VEYKSSLRWDYKEAKATKIPQKAVAKTLAAFFNGQGGTLLIGLKDDGEVLASIHRSLIGTRPRLGFI